MNPARLWFGDDIGARAGRVALRPLELAFRGIAAARNALYDRGVLAAHHSAVPVISVGNLTVGGTGKTPVTAWMATWLRSLGRTPAIVMRGYGADEDRLHRLLNPGIIVVTGSDRVAGIREALSSGADVVVLDDAFQHRRAARDLDIVLVSADEPPSRHLLPAGPLREPLRSLRRADVVVVTAKAAGDAAIARVEAMARTHARDDALVVVARLVPTELSSLDGDASLPLDMLQGVDVLAIAAIGNPDAFRRQLEHLGARVTLRAFPDHHAYTPAEVAALARESGHKYVISTGKDAVKLLPLWPHGAARPWYVCQSVDFGAGADALHATVARAARLDMTSIAG